MKITVNGAEKYRIVFVSNIRNYVDHVNSKIFISIHFNDGKIFKPQMSIVEYPKTWNMVSSLWCQMSPITVRQFYTNAILITN